MSIFIDRKRNFLLLTTFLLWYGCKAEVEEYLVLFKSSSKLVAPYGVCTHINRKGIEWEFDSKEKDLSMSREVGINFIRTDFDWGYCQSDKDGPFSYFHHDNMMQTVNSQNIQMLGILSSPQPYDYDKWKNYVGRTVDHFKSNVRYWEVINEADRWHLRYPNFKPADYVQQIRDIYPLIKKKNRKAKVLFTSITDIKGSFLKEVLNADVSGYFDIMNFHFYVDAKTEPEFLFSYFRQCQNILKKYNIRKPVWFTETGYSTAPGYVDEKTQANRLPRVFLISFACGLEKVFWYKSRAAERSDHLEEHLGIWHKDYTPKPAYYAYKTLVKMCPSGSTRPKITRKGDIFVAKWKQPKGQQVTAFWTSKGSETLSLNSTPVNAYDMMGNKLDVQSNTIVVSPSITYIIGKVEL